MVNGQGNIKRAAAKLENEHTHFTIALRIKTIDDCRCSEFLGHALNVQGAAIRKASFVDER